MESCRGKYPPVIIEKEAMSKIKLMPIPEVLQKHLTIVIYLLVSGICGYLTYLMTDNAILSIIISKAVNYIGWEVEKELQKQGLTRLIGSIK